MKRGRHIVFAQHMRKFKRKRIHDRDPRLKADRCLLEDLHTWKSQGTEISLLEDYNQNICTSELVEALSGPGLEMTEQFLELHREQALHSHMPGSKRPIMGCFAAS